MTPLVPLTPPTPPASFDLLDDAILESETLSLYATDNSPLGLVSLRDLRQYRGVAPHAGAPRPHDGGDLFVGVLSTKPIGAGRPNRARAPQGKGVGLGNPNTGVGGGSKPYARRGGGAICEGEVSETFRTPTVGEQPRYENLGAPSALQAQSLLSPRSPSHTRGSG